MQEIVIISGKGGTGKTSLVAAFAQLSKTELVVADCDVDAADLYLLMHPDFRLEQAFLSGEKAQLDQNGCDQCGLCQAACRFEAIELRAEQYTINALDCEGCGYCARVCPTGAISMVEQKAGDWYRSTTRFGGAMVHARLGIAAENSGKLVSLVKNEARKLAQRKGLETILVDGSPGIGCPVISSLSGADLAILVTEPTISGFHDLKRVRRLVEKFHIRIGCIINKFDLNPEITDQIQDWLDRESISLVARLPYSDVFTEAMTRGQTAIEYSNGTLSQSIRNSWDAILQLNNER